MKHYKIKKNKVRKKIILPDPKEIKTAKIPLVFLNKK